MVFRWSPSDSKSPQVSRTLLSILAVINNAVSTRPPTSKSSSPFSNPLVTFPNAPITIGIIVTCMFHSFFNSLARSKYLSFFSHSFSFILWSPGTAKSTILQVFFFFFFCWLLLSLVFWPGLGDSFVIIFIIFFFRCCLIYILFHYSYSLPFFNTLFLSFKTTSIFFFFFFTGCVPQIFVKFFLLAFVLSVEVINTFIFVTVYTFFVSFWVLFTACNE